MNIQTFINDWIAASNSFDTEKYLNFYMADAILDDPSVGKKFKGHKGIKDYYESYFIGYHTHMRLVRLDLTTNDKAYLEVLFTGEFPEGEIGGTFELTFKNEKIESVKADLIL